MPWFVTWRAWLVTGEHRENGEGARSWWAITHGMWRVEPRIRTGHTAAGDAARALALAGSPLAVESQLEGAELIMSHNVMSWPIP